MLIVIISHPNWFWMTIGSLLLVAEMIGTSGYLLWSGIAALTVGLTCCILFISWEIQGTLFAFLTLFYLLLWHRCMKKKKQSNVLLNQRFLRMNGISLILKEDLVNGIGHVCIGDSSWRVQSDRNLSAGTKVKIIGLDGITLRIISHQGN